MSIGSFLVGFGMGAGFMYWGSDKVHDNVSETLTKTQQILKNEAEINNICYKQIQQWYHEGSLGAVINIMQQQQAARNADLNLQTAAHNLGMASFSPSR